MSGTIEVSQLFERYALLIQKNLYCFARVLRHFVLVPHEICVVPYGHVKIFPERKDMLIATLIHNFLFSAVAATAFVQLVAHFFFFNV